MIINMNGGGSNGGDDKITPILKYPSIGVDGLFSGWESGVTDCSVYWRVALTISCNSVSSSTFTAYRMSQLSSSNCYPYVTDWTDENCPTQWAIIKDSYSGSSAYIGVQGLLTNGNVGVLQRLGSVSTSSTLPNFNFKIIDASRGSSETVSNVYSSGSSRHRNYLITPDKITSVNMDFGTLRFDGGNIKKIKVYGIPLSSAYKSHSSLYNYGYSTTANLYENWLILDFESKQIVDYNITGVTTTSDSSSVSSVTSAICMFYVLKIEIIE